MSKDFHARLTVLRYTSASSLGIQDEGLLGQYGPNVDTA